MGVLLCIFQTTKTESSAWLLLLAFLLPEPHGRESPLSIPQNMWLNPTWLPHLGLNPSVDLPL